MSNYISDELNKMRNRAIADGAKALRFYMSAQYPTHVQIEREEFLRTMSQWVNGVYSAIPHEDTHIDIDPL